MMPLSPLSLLHEVPPCTNQGQSRRVVCIADLGQGYHLPRFKEDHHPF